MRAAADLLAEALSKAGCRKAFGMPGGEVLRLLQALEEAGITFHLAKHETAAGFMAEGVFQVTGQPAILLATLGPGLTNGVNAIANAWQDRVPLIVLTGCVDPIDQVTYTHQVFDHVRLMETVTKGSFTLVDGAVAIVAEKALRLALEGRPGPVHIDVPISLAGKEQPPGPSFHPPVLGERLPGGSALEDAREAYRKAKHPLIIAGMEVLHQGAEEALSQFAKTEGIPVITTYKAKGILEEDHPLALGGAGLSPRADELLLPLVAEADFLLLAGYDPIEMRHGWKHPWDPAKVPVVELTTSAHYHGVHQATVSLEGSIGAALKALSEIHGLAQGEERSFWDGDRLPRLRQQMAERFPRDEGWGPAAVIDEARKALPQDGIATVDSGAHRILLSQIWSCNLPRKLLQSTGFCTMGCALPLAIGAKLANSERPVMAFTGDAGLEMVMGELATLRDLGLPITIIVFVDASLALIELKQRRNGQENRGVDFGRTNFPALAEAMGGHGITVKTREELRQALEEASSRAHFTLIAAEIGRHSYDGRF
ncbi:MAG: thiamine pyrophosphate-binding protein [Kiloniellales bacterium]|nr:thiamine pyrophosphate-binding protein [Kiloniellales bacterium]